MNIKSFFKLAEIQTKVASVVPFLLGSLIAIYRYNSFNIINFIVMFVSLLCIDMATTVINNYIDYKRAIKKHGYGYEEHNAIVRYNIKESQVVSVIGTLLVIAMGFGVILYLRTNVIILLLGALSFFIGIIYSFGPIPISRTPLGELLSGIFMGGIILFIAIYIHIIDKNIINIVVLETNINIAFNFKEIIIIILLSIPTISGIANIMLANNICDREDDIENRRYTLPVYVGNKLALKIFKWIYYIAYIDLLVLIIMRVEPVLSILSLLTFIIVNRNIGTFEGEHVKSKTFILSVKNFLIINGVRVLVYGVSVLAFKF
ncbi:1,4-dihydroxy-2-naphthoate polyprenyltransferase [Clostridium sp. 'White wine YQ']|uniref:1,4-dihydroxy-2-naphthoate polyprenyltransferase n=1 Tax=Clostridium sp. 'White wine YQ' TaxID=3027474 RepID=UPI0023666C53|nr:1,4-dihydroxy-2-naphthoate polyprenyltransferase [Clostridium sp. 'White wine YQ']MDD7795175.1 1,4-dihydroxy-2-naphthoate polyprenyltransferase [Clostridium sp. 'White wine YQ']